MSLVLNVEILGEFKKLTQATKGSEKSLKGLQDVSSKVSKAMNTALGAIGVGLSIGVITQQLKEASKAAIEDAQSQALLANQLKNTTNATKAQIASVEENISKMQMSAGVADDVLRPAFAQLTRATGDTAKATELMQLALDISAGSGKSLESVSMALTKAYNGQFGALTKLGVPMADQILNASESVRIQKQLNNALADQELALTKYGKDSEEYAKATAKVTGLQEKLTLATKDGTDWQSQLADAFKGSAAEAANLDPYNKMQIIFGEMQEKVGAALLPVLSRFSTWLSSPGGTKALETIITVLVDLIEKGIQVVDWVVQYKDALIPLTAGIAALTIGIKATTAAFTVYNTIATAVIAKNAAVVASNGAVAASNTAVATTAGIAVTALRALALLNPLLLTLSLGGSAAQPGTVPSTMPRPADLPNTPVVPPQAATGIPGFGGPVIPASPTTDRPVVPTVKPTAAPKPTVTVNNTVNVKSTTASPKQIVSSLQSLQSSTGVSIARLLK